MKTEQIKHRTHNAKQRKVTKQKTNHAIKTYIKNQYRAAQAHIRNKSKQYKETNTIIIKQKKSQEPKKKQHTPKQIKTHKTHND